MVSDVILEQPSKQLFPKLVTVVGDVNVMLVKLLLFSKQLASILFMDRGIVTFCKLIQSLNVFTPKEVKLFERVIEDNPELSKQPAPVLVTELGKIIFCKRSQFLKQLLPMVFTAEVDVNVNVVN